MAGLESPREVVNVGAGGSELLGSDDGVSFHCGSKSVGHYSCNFGKFVSTEANEGLGQARGQRGVGLTIQWWVNVYSKWGRRYLLDRGCGRVWDILYRLFQLLSVIARLDSSNDVGELWVEGGGWVLRVVGWC